MVKREFRVEDMHCPNCAMHLESIEDDLPGVCQVSASYQRRRMVVEFDEGQVNEAQIISAAEALGYHAIPII